MGELDDFKRSVDLEAFAKSRGYVKDEKESGRMVSMLRHANGDKIAVKRAEDSGFWVYFSNRDSRDHGTIVDFLQWRGAGSLGDVRKILRAWAGEGKESLLPPPTFAPALLPRSRDRGAVIMAWEAAHYRAAIPYLIGRGLGPDLLTMPRFVDCCRVDKRGNVLFPHYDKGGLCGFEIKNKNFTGFAAGGTKGLWVSRCCSSDRCLVFTESAIDALSFHVLNPSDSARYMSTGGTMNAQQGGLIRAAMEKMPPGSSVLLAFDNDAGGQKLAEEVRALAPSSVEVRRALPDHGKDWNEALKAKL